MRWVLSWSALLLAACAQPQPDTASRIDALMRPYAGAVPGASVLDGRLSLDDAVRKWLPSLPPAADAVTVRQLLTHTSGLLDYEDLIPPGTTQQVHDADVLRLLESQNSTYFTPGTNYRYSNTGYALLALLVARASGKDFASFLRARIFLPLEMRATLAYEAGISTVAHRAFGYSYERATWRRTDQSVTSAVLGDGGVYSSIDDLAQWDAALYDERVLSARSLRLAFTPATATDDPAVHYGFGWRITGETLWHSGETVGFRTVIIRYPRHHFTVIVLTNRDEPEPYPLALAIAKLYLPDADAERASGSASGPDPLARPLPGSGH